MSGHSARTSTLVGLVDITGRTIIVELRLDDFHIGIYVCDVPAQLVDLVVELLDLFIQLGNIVSILYALVFQQRYSLDNGEVASCEQYNEGNSFYYVFESKHVPEPFPLSAFAVINQRAPLSNSQWSANCQFTELDMSDARWCRPGSRQGQVSCMRRVIDNR